VDAPERRDVDGRIAQMDRVVLHQHLPQPAHREPGHLLFADQRQHHHAVQVHLELPAQVRLPPDLDDQDVAGRERHLVGNGRARRIGRGLLCRGGASGQGQRHQNAGQKTLHRVGFRMCVAA
jgi:hypothetical protein